ncbi:MAG: NifU family protein [Chlamydiales bacterium]|nr:NifU family protein [Chlamydiales bacterium]
MQQLSKKNLSHLENALSAGHITAEEAAAKMMRLAIGREGSLELGRLVQFYLLVDPTDGVIADAKFQAFGPPELIAIADYACGLLLRKNYEQARRLSAELLDKQMRGKNEESAFSEETAWVFNQVIEAVERAAEQCMDIPIVDAYVAPPISDEEMDLGEKVEYPGWKGLSVAQKMSVIEEVIARDIRPYVELDAGGVQVVDFVGEREVLISYQGACTTCYSSTGATLNSIQQILRAKIYPDLIIVPT